MAGDLGGRVAVVMGAGTDGSGISNGQAAALAYAAAGAQVICADRDPEAAERTCTSVRMAGGAAYAYTADVTDEASMERTRTIAEDTYGAVHVLHHNVGIVTLGGPVETSPEAWARTVDANLTGAYLALRVFLPVLEATPRAAAVLVGSISAERWIGVPFASYAATKAGLLGLMRNVALQYANKDVRVNCLMPGLLDTPLVRNQMTAAYGGDVEAMMAKRHAQVPMGFMGTPEDLAHAAVFLASDRARYITGQTLTIDGGLSLALPGT